MPTYSEEIAILAQGFDLLPDHLIITDKNHCIIYANKAAEKNTGFSIEEMLGKNPGDLWGGHMTKKFYDDMRRVIHIEKRPFIREIKNVKKDGTEYWQELHIVPVLNAAHEIKFFIGLEQDITQKKQLQKDLTDETVAARNVLEDLQTEKDLLAVTTARYEAIFESIGDGIAVVNKNGQLEQFNDQAEKILGMGLDKNSPNTWQSTYGLFDPITFKSIPEDQMPLLQALKGEKIVKSILFVKNQNVPSGKYISVTATPIMLNGKASGSVAIFDDITKEKETEKIRADFLALASHQLRTPLSGVKWLIDTLQRGTLGPVPKKQKEYLDHIAQMNERMIKLVSEMLDVLMLESGIMTVKKEKITMPKLYEELFLMMKFAADNKQITLRNITKNSGSLTIQSNLQILRSVLESLISNAINYSARGQEIILDTKEKKNEIIFSIKDSGIGIPKEEQKKIFERFYRASNAKKTNPNGTGLGLYIASLLAKRIGGNISFESKPGQGTTFYLKLPKNGLRAKLNNKST